MSYDSRNDTVDHIEKVSQILGFLATCIMMRSKTHDMSKLVEPEKSLYDEFVPKLQSVEYGSDEYNEILKEMKPATDHHYSVNRHHPEFFDHGIKGMNLVDLIELFADWIGAASRSEIVYKENVIESLNKNKERFGLSDDLLSIFINTLDSYHNDKLDWNMEWSDIKWEI